MQIIVLSYSALLFSRLRNPWAFVLSSLESGQKESEWKMEGDGLKRST